MRQCLVAGARRERALRVTRAASRTVRAMDFLLSILSTFCLLSVSGTCRTSTDTIARSADEIDTFRCPPMSAGVHDQNSHGENRGSSPLGSANKISMLVGNDCRPISTASLFMNVVLAAVAGAVVSIGECCARLKRSLSLLLVKLCLKSAPPHSPSSAEKPMGQHEISAD